MNKRRPTLSFHSTANRNHHSFPPSCHSFEGVSCGIIIQDSHGHVLEANATACRLLGLTHAQLLASSYPPSWSLSLPDGASVQLEDIPTIFNPESEQSSAGTSLVVIALLPQGKRHWLTLSSVQLLEATTAEPNVITTVFDISEQKQTELHETLLKEINQMVLEGKPAKAVLDYLCQQLVYSFDNYPWAWIGMKEPDGTVSIHSIFGVESAQLTDLQVRWDESEYGQNPVGLAIRSGHSQVHSLYQNPLFEFRWKMIEHLALRSVVAIPLMAGSEAIGALALYSKDAEAFYPRLVSRLELFAAQAALALAAAKNREQLLHCNLLTERTRDIIVLIAPDGHILNCNEAAVQTYGYTREELLSMNFHDLESSPGQINTLPLSEQALQEGRLYENLHQRQDGSLLPVEVSSQPADLDGQAIVLCVVRDISQRKQILNALRTSEQRHTEILEYMSNAVAVYEVIGDGEDFIMKEVNRAVEVLNGIPRTKLLGQSVTLHFPHKKELTPLLEVMRRVWHSGQPEQYSVIFRDGTRITGWRENYIYKLSSGEIVDVFEDITDQKLAEEDRRQLVHQLAYQANHDALTGLPNRSCLNNYLQQALDRAEQNTPHTGLALLFIDVDQFKLINDTLGHDFGDLLLQSVASRLKSCLRKGDIISRFGGDEFVIVLPDLNSTKDISLIAQKLLAAFNKPFVIQAKEIFITASIGITVYPLDGDTIESLIKNADTAMYSAKAAGRNNFQFFTQTLNVMTQERLSLGNKLTKALERQEFLLHYQPQIDLLSGRLIGLEALIRWQDAEQGLILPAQFIPLAEETGLIVPIGEWVLRTACQQMRSWQSIFPDYLSLAVNLSMEQIRQPNFTRRVAQILRETGLDPNILELEITESTAMQNAEATINILHELKKMGIRISIDDFGTGFSSLNYLRRLPIDSIKIDKTFISDLEGPNGSADIVRTIITLSQTLHLKVIAEGVETERQADFLRSHNCNLAQGYLFSPPLPPAATETFLARCLNS